ncbi:MAG: hypothetical protein EB120_05440 [Proteobacteria bacterium]|nr:hypothetical protein [Pseudomonadota bacterium]
MAIKLNVLLAGFSAMLAGAALLPIIPKSNAETLPVFKAIARGALANPITTLKVRALISLNS